MINNDVGEPHINSGASAVKTWHRNISWLTAYFLLAMTASGLWIYLYPMLSNNKKAPVIKITTGRRKIAK